MLTLKERSHVRAEKNLAGWLREALGARPAIKMLCEAGVK